MPGQPYGSMGSNHASPCYFDSPGVQEQLPRSFTDAASLPANKAQGAFLLSQRRRINSLPICLSLLLPWLLFCVVFMVMSFSLHYNQPWLCCLVVGMTLLLVVILGCFVIDSTKNKIRNNPQRQPTWLIFMFLTCFLAWFLADSAGDYNYLTNLKPFYDIQGLTTYLAVDPAAKRGKQVMDGGRIVFTPDSRVDISKGMGFHNVDTYCVAPVTSLPRGNDTKLDTYDFWVVGVNCCGATIGTPDYHCGQFSNPRANGGLRLMDDYQRPFFRLAVQQAEAAYKIQASHPLFYTWVQDPVAESLKLQDAGYRYYMMVVFSYFVLQLFLVISATIAFSKLGHL